MRNRGEAEREKKHFMLQNDIVFGGEPGRVAKVPRGKSTSAFPERGWPMCHFAVKLSC